MKNVGRIGAMFHLIMRMMVTNTLALKLVKK